MTMKYPDEVMFNDLRRYFRLLRRDLHNHVLKQRRRGTLNPYPDGKTRYNLNYEQHLRDLFAEFGKYYFLKMVFVGPVAYRVTTSITKEEVDTSLVPFPRHKKKTLVQTNVGFDDFGDAIATNGRTHAHLIRIRDCYIIALRCEEIYRRSKHEDFTIKCNSTYRTYMLKVFNRFGLNPKCVVADYNMKGKPVLILNMGKDVK